MAELPAPPVPPLFDPSVERTFEGLTAPELKAVIVDAGLAGIYSVRDTEDLISFYGLRHQ